MTYVFDVRHSLNGTLGIPDKSQRVGLTENGNALKKRLINKLGVISIHQHEFDVDCIVFDKDGTLIELNALWGGRSQRWVEAISASTGLMEKTRQDLYAILGYSPVRGYVHPESPLAMAPLEMLYTLAAGVIYQAGIPWHQARNHVISCAQDTILAAIDLEEIRPRGDIVGVMHQLIEAQICIAVVTSDDRHMTEAALEFLGVKDMISIIICGDDPISNKPSPEALWQVSTQLGIETKRIMMVGDSLSDMQFASNAGAAFRIGVASTPENITLLAPHADALVESIGEFRVQTKKR
jgi:phosphoglycolate phosphatase-like HAD superfamily hydrolase